ncbi:MAG: aminoacyl-histidine dipeptidase [Ignavibacteriae bacterium]|nr:aminoacyl-histidine dipeptidase [Ignavibacteriota bacterium]NOG97440.1 aminoacyl-histidine dipeptidase [Ignavibacteriota bacterium]
MSKEVIEGLKPELIWNYFYEISQVPRPSKKEEKIIEYVKKFAADRNLELKQDETGNLVIKVPATPGYENAPTVVLQGHLDIVCEKNKGTEHDFDNDPIKLIRDGEWITADGTTLGADNGIGVAAAMALSTDPDVTHGPLEILCTVDEETGMTGVMGLQPGFISGEMLLNMDSEEDGAFYVGCSGGQDTMGVFKISWAQAKKDLAPYELMVTGLKGGHSGLDVAAGRGNAIQMLGRMLKKFPVKYRVAKLIGGSKRNAIPREAEAVILIDPKDESTVAEFAKKYVADLLLEYEKNDGGLDITLKKLNDNYDKVWKKKFTKRIVNALSSLPNGIQAMSADIPDLVETSTNLATVTMEGDELRIGTSQRSSIEPAKHAISGAVKAILELAGADEILVGDGYPGWQPNMDSALLKFSKEVFNEMYGKDPEIKAIHAGLECGLLGATYPGLDMISFGPTIEGAHSPDEKLNIKDVEKFYNLGKALLEKIAKKN